MAEVVTDHPVPRRPGASRADQAPMAKVVQPVGCSTLTIGTWPAPLTGGSTADGMISRAVRAGVRRVVGPDRTQLRHRAIGVPLTRVIRGQSRSAPGTRTRRPAPTTAMRGTPSKLVMRVRFPSPAPMFHRRSGHLCRAPPPSPLASLAGFWTISLAQVHAWNCAQKRCNTAGHAGHRREPGCRMLIIGDAAAKRATAPRPGRRHPRPPADALLHREVERRRGSAWTGRCRRRAAVHH